MRFSSIPVCIFLSRPSPSITHSYLVSLMYQTPQFCATPGVDKEKPRRGGAMI